MLVFSCIPLRMKVACHFQVVMAGKLGNTQVCLAPRTCGDINTHPDPHLGIKRSMLDV
jgi:hypothetical protein